MSKELNATLRKIVVTIADEAAMPRKIMLPVDARVAQINQAYREAGYAIWGHHTIAYPDGKVELIMTSQEFLTRFTRELETMQPLMSPTGYEKFRKAALAVAERATT